jgi:hypothetical protein
MSEGKKEYILKAAMRLPIPFVDSPGQRVQRVHKLGTSSSISPVAHPQQIPPLQHSYTPEQVQAMPTLQMVSSYLLVVNAVSIDL